MEFKTDVNNPNVVHISFKNDYKEKGRETVYENNGGLIVNIVYYWDSHGKLVPWEGPNGRTRESLNVQSVKIEKHDYSIKFSDGERDYTEYNLYLDGKAVKDVMTVYSYRYNPITNKLFVEAIVGEG